MGEGKWSFELEVEEEQLEPTGRCRPLVDRFNSHTDLQMCSFGPLYFT